MTRARTAIAAVLTILVLTATACTSDTPVHGRVTGKEYEPAHTTWTTEPTTRRTCTTTTRRAKGRTTTSRSCRTVRTGSHRVRHHTAACWELDLDTGREVCVSPAKWRRTHVGDRI